MSVVEFLAMLEIALVNIFTFDRCCRKRYTAACTAVALAGFTALIFVLLYGAKALLGISQTGSGLLIPLGFLYLLPLGLLYRERLSRVFAVMCMCWLYTMGMQALAFHGVRLWGEDENYLSVLLVSSVLFLLTLVPFYKYLVPKYIFILQQTQPLGRHWNGYLVCSGGLHFALLAVLHIEFLQAAGSLMKLLILVLLLSATFFSYALLYKMVSDTAKMNHLEHQVLHDPLTGLCNRVQLFRDLERLLEEEREFSVLFMDLDGFKQVNDRYGHTVGDRYLQHFAAISADICSAGGQVYRFGGDEFMVLYTGALPAETVESLRECRGWEPCAPCPFNQVSIGVLSCRPPHKSVEEILRLVDEKMYADKSK